MVRSAAVKFQSAFDQPNYNMATLDKNQHVVVRAYYVKR